MGYRVQCSAYYSTAISAGPNITAVIHDLITENLVLAECSVPV